ncbi:hypothetical protein KQ939_13990 [Planococcus sp. CP5-4]|uniref:spore germination protein GerW family protein n=1 Tax=unclassified Planococcus (in: firmicutes) TaxID=2662419 RepID=UPI001C22FD31|nr:MULTISPECIES: spore germination protein GerW family protein [unclassified Planococcus (in: firmicutes)]MBU9674046.1 hypothetical protein [Planococcus sp. CP5-4_YE]MBV0909917.1 hypothetical protein [Planococcus sp. CP5-4_UN]MBW6064797.1 hypothetical protein [Planococcus sp. CP5-4]
MEEKETIPFQSSPVRPIFEKFSTARDVSLVYGDPIEMQGRTIIPVAKIRYSVGAGAGGGYGPPVNSKGHEENTEMAGGHGEGAGGSFSVKPIGIYDVTAEKTVYRPILPIELIVMLPLMMTGLGFLMASSQNNSKGGKHKKRMQAGKRCDKKGKGKKLKGLGYNG